MTFQFTSKTSRIYKGQGHNVRNIKLYNRMTLFIYEKIIKALNKKQVYMTASSKFLLLLSNPFCIESVKCFPTILSSKAERWTALDWSSHWRLYGIELLGDECHTKWKVSKQTCHKTYTKEMTNMQSQSKKKNTTFKSCQNNLKQHTIMDYQWQYLIIKKKHNI